MQPTTTPTIKSNPSDKPPVVVIHNEPRQPHQHYRGPIVASLLVAVLFLVGATYFVNYRTAGDAPVANLSPAQVQITADGFSPATVKLKKGQQLTWTNSDLQPRALIANNDSLPALSESTLLATDESQTITVEKSGTFVYHDATSTTNFSGTIIVE